MPVVVQGALETRKALRKFAPDLYKEMNKEIRVVLKEIVMDARSHVLSPYPGYLYNWQTKNVKERGPYIKGRDRLFPSYDAGEIKRGLTQRLGSTKSDKNGFSMLYYIENKSPAGMIYEVAGRKSGFRGQPHIGKGLTHSRLKGKSSSRNPNAGAIFINSLGPLYGKSTSFLGDARGRLAYRAVYENNGRAIKAIEIATRNAVHKYYSRTHELAA